MKTLIGMLVASTLATSALAETMDQVRMEFMNGVLHQCLAGDEWLRAFGRDPEKCACFAGHLGDSLTMSDAVSLSNGINTPGGFSQKTYRAANACL